MNRWPAPKALAVDVGGGTALQRTPVPRPRSVLDPTGGLRVRRPDGCFRPRLCEISSFEFLMDGQPGRRAKRRATAPTARRLGPLVVFQCFRVPNTCSTVRLRIVICFGFRSSLACKRSSTASCSQRRTRRSLPVVHCVRSAHALQALLQYE